MNRRRREAAAVALMAGLGAVHAVIVATHYHVGSFDDDASYVLAARAVASGHGLTSRMAGGYPLIGVYPPGYPALLGPLAAIWPDGVQPFRILSLLLYVAIFPLTWSYLKRRGLPQAGRLVVLALLALNPVLATYATMVMPEVAFVVILLVMLLAVDRWQLQATTITRAGMASVLGAAALPWFKEAGAGLVVGLVIWLAWRRLWPKAVLVAVIPAALFLPLLVARARAGAALIGSRYSRDIGGAFKGGPIERLRHVVPHAAATYVSQAIPRSIVPTRNGFLPNHGPVGAGLLVLTWTAAPLAGAGAAVWFRRHRDAGGVATIAYLFETLIYPFTNERRVVLVLPIVVGWYVVGAAWLFAAVRRAGAGVGTLASRLAAGLPIVVTVVVAGALASQFTRDYLYFEGASSSAPGGSPYMAMLRRLGTPQDVVETDYLWTTALYARHRTANGAYVNGCDPQPVTDAIRADGAAYLLTASLNGSGPVDGTCILPTVARLPGAVRLYRADQDSSSVFELVGPGTGNPSIRDLTSGAIPDGSQPVTAVAEAPQAVGDPGGRYLTTTAVGGTATLTWTWPVPVPISQLSLGAAGSLGGATTSIMASVRAGDGRWRAIASETGPVGPLVSNPFLLVRMAPEALTAIRLIITVSGSATIAVHDFHALGPSP